MPLASSPVGPVPPVETIRCLGYAERVHWPHRHDYRLSGLFLGGRAQVQPSGVTLWWLDEEVQEHNRFVERGQPEPKFVFVGKAGIVVDVQGVRQYSVRFVSP